MFPRTARLAAVTGMWLLVLASGCRRGGQGPTTATSQPAGPEVVPASAPEQGRVGRSGEAPVGETEWNLANAPGYWTLQVGHYVDPGPAFPGTARMELPAGWNRRQAAVDACRELRSRSIEAYYYHGERMSLLTVGSFPRDAFDYVPDPTNPRYDKYDPATDEYLDERVKSVRNMTVKTADGADEQPFRYNLENGLKVTKVFRAPDGRVERRPWASFLVKIPKP